MPATIRHCAIAATVTASLVLLAACGETRKSLPSQPGSEMLPAVAGPGSVEPHLSATPGGQVVMSWLEPDRDGVELRYALLQGRQWSQPRGVARGDDWFVNWADFPSVVPITDTFWAAHWLRKTPGNAYSYDVVLALSRDGGHTWNKPFVAHDDGTASEHGFVSLFAWNGDLAAVWLDGRETAGEPAGPMTLRRAVFAPDGSAGDNGVLDPRVCDCCQTDVAMTANGPVVVYRDRGPDEIRDISIARHIDGRWQSGIPVAADGWRISGCPVNGPAVAARGLQLAVAWFTAANDRPAVRIAFSNDGGAQFGTPAVIDDLRPIGRVGIVLTPSDDAAVSWLADVGDGRAAIRAVRVAADGRLGEVREIATTAAGRLSGFPQLGVRDDELIVAWTDIGADGPSVRTAAIALSRL